MSTLTKIIITFKTNINSEEINYWQNNLLRKDFSEIIYSNFLAKDITDTIKLKTYYLLNKLYFGNS